MKKHLTLSALGNELKIVLIIDFLNSDFTGSRSHIVLLYFIGEERARSRRKGGDVQSVCWGDGGGGVETDGYRTKCNMVLKFVNFWDFNFASF